MLRWSLAHFILENEKVGLLIVYVEAGVACRLTTCPKIIGRTLLVVVA